VAISVHDIARFLKGQVRDVPDHPGWVEIVNYEGTTLAALKKDPQPRTDR